VSPGIPQPFQAYTGTVPQIAFFHILSSPLFTKLFIITLYINVKAFNEIVSVIKWRHEDEWGGGIAPHIFNLGTRWRTGQLHAPAALQGGNLSRGTC
jgi:hypothetical protein